MPRREIPGTDVHYHLVLFDKDGQERREADGTTYSTRLLEAASDAVTDIFVISHGWKGDVPAAISQYDSWIGSMTACTEDRARIREAVPGFRSLVVGVHWPSLPWGVEDADAALLGDEEGSGAPSETEELDAEDAMATGRLVDLYAERLGDSPETREALEAILSAADDPELGARLGGRVRAGEVPERLARAYETLFQQTGLGTDGELGAPGADQETFDPAAAMRPWMDEESGVDEESGEDDEDLTLGGGTSRRRGGIRRALLGPVRQLSFWTMKKRARTVGESGVHDLLRALQDAAPEARMHLMGHSFGCIVVSAAVAGPVGADGRIGGGLPRPVDSVLLVQGALSLWSYATTVPFAPHAPGYFRPLLVDPARVRGPLVATLSSFDKAVGTFYPVGAFFGDDLLLDDKLPRFGAIGAFGMQAADAVPMGILPATGEYDLQPGRLYNVDASSVIANGTGPSGAHSDITHPETAHLMWEAVISAAQS